MRQLLMILVMFSLLSGCSFLFSNKNRSIDVIKKADCSSYNGVISTVNNGSEVYCVFPDGKVIPAF